MMGPKSIADFAHTEYCTSLSPSVRHRRDISTFLNLKYLMIFWKHIIQADHLIIWTTGTSLITWIIRTAGTFWTTWTTLAIMNTLTALTTWPPWPLWPSWVLRSPDHPDHLDHLRHMDHLDHPDPFQLLEYQWREDKFDNIPTVQYTYQMSARAPLQFITEVTSMSLAAKLFHFENCDLEIRVWVCVRGHDISSLFLELHNTTQHKGDVHAFCLSTQHISYLLGQMIFSDGMSLQSIWTGIFLQRCIFSAM